MDPTPTIHTTIAADGETAPIDAVDSMDSVLEDAPAVEDGPDTSVPAPSGAILEPPGTPARTHFDQTHEVLIRVSFKIESKKEVDQSEGQTSEVEEPDSDNTTIVDSADLSEAQQSIRVTLYGKSLNDLKLLCGEACDKIYEGMKHVVLTSNIAQDLIWQGQVGTTKLTLDSFSAFVQFVDRVNRSHCKLGDVLIRSPNAAEKKKQAEARAALLAEYERVKAEIKRYETAYDLFQRNEEIGMALGMGNSLILTAPWDTTFHYRLSLEASQIWARAIIDGSTTGDMPPDSVAYRQAITPYRVTNRTHASTRIPISRGFKRPRP